MQERFISSILKVAPATAAALLCACTDAPRELPGNLQSPGLARMLNDALAAEFRRMEVPDEAMRFKPDAAVQTRRWLGGLKEVVARCRHGPDNDTKANLLEYDIRLQDGTSIENVYSGRNCAYWSELRPLVMRVRWENGRVAEVLTDGRESRSPPSFFQNDATSLVIAVLRTDRARHAAAYFEIAPTTADNARAWQEKERAR